MAAGTLESVKNTLGSDPAQCANIVDEATKRMLASATIHRRLHDLGLFSGVLKAMRRDVATAAIDERTVTLYLNAEELDLSLDQKSVVAMMVVEVANNSAKHVFQRQLGSRFQVALRSLGGHRAVLRISDDEPGFIASPTTERHLSRNWACAYFRDWRTRFTGPLSLNSIGATQ